MRALAIATLSICLASSSVGAQWPVPVEGAVADDRYAHLRLPEAYATARVWSDRRVIASWYDCERPGHCSKSKRTASGERFNPDAFTCAHRSLPFGTMVRVTYRKRSANCRVNDRGPFIKGRAIDLARAVARAIGLPGAGPVTIQRL